MDLKIQEIKDKENWEDFILGCKEKTFLDSWNWGEFQEKQGNKVWRLGLYENQELIASALVIKIKAKRGTFLFVPHGPNVIEQRTANREQILKILLNTLKEIGKKEKASFIRIAPIWDRKEENIIFFKKLGFKNAPIHIHPEITWELDITPSEEELLISMRKTTRYLIKQGLRNKALEIIKSRNIEDLKIFNEIYQETAARHNFVPFPLEYLRNQFSAFNPDEQISIFLAKYKEKIVSGAIIVFWQNIAFYHHSASLSKYRKIPVSYFLQWEVIKEAKRRGCQCYNFWGIAPEIRDESQVSKSKHPWAGLTLFKMGFGGYRKEYVKTQDLPFSLAYWLTYFFEKLRKIKRGL